MKQCNDYRKSTQHWKRGEEVKLTNINRLAVAVIAFLAIVLVVLSLVSLGGGNRVVNFAGDIWYNVISVSPPTGEHANQAVVSSNQFAIDLYRQIATEDPSSNQFFSPWSVFLAFALAAEGATGDTAQEIWRTLGLDDQNEQERQQTLHNIIDYVNDPSNEHEFELANSLWLSITPRQEYLDITKNYYDADVLNLPASTLPINDWVTEKTRGKLTEAGINSLSDELNLLLLNALYFKGTWKTQFNPDDTGANGEFWTGEQMISIPLMNLFPDMLDNAPLFNYFEDENLQAIELPYRGDKLSMLLLLPREMGGIAVLEQLITTNRLAIIKEGMINTLLDRVLVPKFELNADYDLIPLLRTLGIETAFGDFADFSKLGVDIGEVFIGEAKQAATINVDEEGTEAAAVTTVGLVTLSPPPKPSFIADHPFIFTIQDNATGHIIFMGKIIDPSQ